MMAPELTSIIMVTYHTGRVLEAAIDAVLDQTAEVELILVNNGNPPELEKRLIEKFRDDPAVRLMTGHGNIGLARGYNLGVRVASGDHVLLVNPRCLLPPTTVAVLIEQAATAQTPYLLGARLVDQMGRNKKGSRCSLLSPASAAIEGLHLAKYFPGRRLYLHQEPLPAKKDLVPAISGSFMFLRTKNYLSVHGFLECYKTYVADMDFCYRFNQWGGHTYFLPQLKVFMADKEKSAPVVQREEEKVLEFIRYFHENHGDKYFQPLLWAIYGVIWLRGKLRALLSAVI
ncbi:MAG: glycosyltransferase family 2 protein [Alphaproteobacteria bacterium]|nr:glycosyltransferase family 2 protein [Alphaproteobacteria bacterium]